MAAAHGRERTCTRGAVRIEDPAIFGDRLAALTLVACLRGAGGMTCVAVARCSPCRRVGL